MSEPVIIPAWQRRDETIERDAIEFWTRLAILPPGTDPATRARELVTIARHGSALTGVATASIEALPALRARFAMLRCAVAPSYRRSRLASELIASSQPVLERWSLENPAALLQGIGIILEADLGDKAREPVWPRSGLTLIGYSPQGKQIRVAWFGHARVG